MSNRTPSESHGSTHYHLNECPICYEATGDAITTNCNHKFCRNCLARWTALKNTCPMCRTVLCLRTRRMFDPGSPRQQRQQRHRRRVAARDGMPDVQPSSPADVVVGMCLQLSVTAMCTLSLAICWACILLTISVVLILVQIVWTMRTAFWTPLGGVMLLWWVWREGLVGLPSGLEWIEGIAQWFEGITDWIKAITARIEGTPARLGHDQ